MPIFDSPSESEDDQQITTHNNYHYNFDVSPGLLSFLYLILMLLGIFGLFEYQYQLYHVNANNNTDDSFLHHNTNDSLI